MNKVLFAIVTLAAFAAIGTLVYNNQVKNPQATQTTAASGEKGACCDSGCCGEKTVAVAKTEKSCCSEGSSCCADKAEGTCCNGTEGSSCSAAGESSCSSECSGEKKECCSGSCPATSEVSTSKECPACTKAGADCKEECTSCKKDNAEKTSDGEN